MLEVSDAEMLLIRRTAAHVRAWAERHAKRKSKKDFFKSPDLSCMCAYASAVLFDALSTNSYIAHHLIFVEGDSHCYLTFKHLIIDITATQFGAVEPVVIQQIGTKIKGISDYDYRDYYACDHVKYYSLSSLFAFCDYDHRQFFDSRREFNNACRSYKRFVRISASADKYVN